MLGKPFSSGEGQGRRSRCSSGNGSLPNGSVLIFCRGATCCARSSFLMSELQIWFLTLDIRTYVRYNSCIFFRVSSRPNAARDAISSRMGNPLPPHLSNRIVQRPKFSTSPPLNAKHLGEGPPKGAEGLPCCIRLICLKTNRAKNHPVERKVKMKDLSSGTRRIAIFVCFSIVPQFNRMLVQPL